MTEFKLVLKSKNLSEKQRTGIQQYFFAVFLFFFFAGLIIRLISILLFFQICKGAENSIVVIWDMVLINPQGGFYIRMSKNA